MASARHVIVAGAGIAGLTRGAVAGTRRVARHCARAGGQAGRGRRRHSALAECHPHPERARIARTAGVFGHRARGNPRHGRALGPREIVAHPVGRRRGAALRRAISHHPSRRSAVRACGSRAQPARYRAQARHPGRRFRDPRQRHHRAGPPRPRHDRRARHRADRRRRRVVEHASAHRQDSTSRDSPARTAWRALAPGRWPAGRIP